MVLVVVFGVALLIAVLLSGPAARTVLSTSFLFLVGGALVSDGFLGLIHITPDSEIVSVTADLALFAVLFAVLFTDGVHVSFPKLRATWRNPARALGLGMALAFVGMALITHYLVGLDWTTSFLVGAVLTPTDPVFAAAVVGCKEVPAKLRQSLNVESADRRGGRPGRRVTSRSALEEAPGVRAELTLARWLPRHRVRPPAVAPEGSITQALAFMPRALTPPAAPGRRVR